MERFKFGFVGGVTAPPAKELEGVGQQLSFTGSNFLRGGGKKLWRLRWFFSPCPLLLWVSVKKPWVSETFRFMTLLKAVVGKGADTISNAEVSRPFSLGR